MFGTHDLALFAFTVLVLNATPGVDLMLITTRTLQHGVRAGLVTAAGSCAGCIVHTLAAAFGLAALLAASAAAFSVIKWVGAAYLAWLAIGMLRQAWARPAPGAAAASTVALAGGGAGEWFRTGLLTNALNPKVALFFLALLPQFIDAAAADKTAAFLFLGAWFIVQSYLFLALLVIVVAPLRRWQAPAAVQRGVWAVAGALFMALAARLALAQRP
jgi:threonine/homoserine/homoserine lactone efflux protein